MCFLASIPQNIQIFVRFRHFEFVPVLDRSIISIPLYLALSEEVKWEIGAVRKLRSSAFKQHQSRQIQFGFDLNIKKRPHIEPIFYPLRVLQGR